MVQICMLTRTGAQREAPDGGAGNQAAFREPGAILSGAPAAAACADLRRGAIQSLKALRGGMPSAMQPVTAAQQQQQHDAAMAHGAAQAIATGRVFDAGWNIAAATSGADRIGLLPAGFCSRVFRAGVILPVKKDLQLD
jgi:hypothetical protein